VRGEVVKNRARAPDRRDAHRGSDAAGRGDGGPTAPRRASPPSRSVGAPTRCHCRAPHVCWTTGPAGRSGAARPQARRGTCSSPRASARPGSTSWRAMAPRCGAPRRRRPSRHLYSGANLWPVGASPIRAAFARAGPPGRPTAARRSSASPTPCSRCDPPGIAWGPPAYVRADQPLLAIARARRASPPTAGPPGPPGTSGRPCCRVHSMFTEEIGVSPNVRRRWRALPRPHRRVHHRRAVLRPHRRRAGGVKAEIGAHLGRCQVQACGWTAAARHRRRHRRYGQRRRRGAAPRRADRELYVKRVQHRGAAGLRARSGSPGRGRSRPFCF